MPALKSEPKLSKFSQSDKSVSNGPCAVARPTSELVIGMVGAVGAGVTKTANELKGKLETDYDYHVEIIRVSDIISSMKTLDSTLDSTSRITQLQKLGTELRNDFGEDILISKAIEKIAISRDVNKGYDHSKTVPQAINRRIATIIDSIKHPEESKKLSDVYGDVYWQFTVFAPETVRENRLRNIGVDKGKLHGIFTTDTNDKDNHGQKVSDTALLSNFFVRNDGQNTHRLESVLDRFLEILFNVSTHTPTQQETGMLTAVTAASKSACLSRQVGAALYSNKNELLSTGCNDAPRYGGGLYKTEDNDCDHRCYKWQSQECHNDRHKKELYSQIFEKINTFENKLDQEKITSALKKTPIKGLIEYSRAVHAEMEAILSVARTGKLGIVGGSLYSTTYPCHNCARHIVASGIENVYYIEPYAKSLAIDLHSDAISVSENDTGKVAFLQYEGVGPRSMLKLFGHGLKRKDEGKAIQSQKKTANPVFAPSIDGFTTHEIRVIKQLKDLNLPSEESAANV
nr:anti-phage dCTP deaminase [uncultured Cohaesibacter sp.]